jgi:hypothetical protein
MTNPTFAAPEPGPGTPNPYQDPAAGPSPTPVVPAPAPRKQGSMLLNGLLAVALLVAVGGVAFAVGRATAPAPAQTGRFGNGGGFVGGANGPQGSFAPGGNVNPGQGGFRGGGIFGAGASLAITGTVTKVDASGVTIKTASGNEITVSTDGSTTYHAATSGTAGDVTVGATVAVQVAGFGGRGFGGGNGAGNGGNGAPPPSLGTGNTGGAGNGGTGGTTAGPTITATDITVQK